MSPLAPVGWASSGAGRWGQLDLVGNVEEWTLDTINMYVQDDNELYGYVTPCTDCVDLGDVDYKSIRGSSFYDGQNQLLPPFRDYYASKYRSYEIGFRCARTP